MSQEYASKEPKQVLTDNTVQAHFDPSYPMRILWNDSDAVASCRSRAFSLLQKQQFGSHRDCFHHANQIREPVPTNPDRITLHHLWNWLTVDSQRCTLS